MSKSRIASALLVLALGFMLGMAVNTPVAPLSSRASAITEVPSSDTKGAQRIWEYRVLYRSIYQAEDKLEPELNKLGREGFEVCGMTPKGSRELLVVLRRPGR
jgi:hypothetical protein